MIMNPRTSAVMVRATLSPAERLERIGAGLLR